MNKQMEMTRRFLLKGAGAGAMAVAAGSVPFASASRAFAQDSAPQSDAAEQDQSIVVTGSRIASGFDRPTPVSVMSAERLEARGATNLGDALNELPAFRATNTPASA